VTGSAVPRLRRAAVAAKAVVFLLDGDNTLLDNDRVQADLREHLARRFGAAARDRYGAIVERLRAELGYTDYLGALQRYRAEHPHEPCLLLMPSWLIDYPVRERLYPGVPAVVDRLKRWGRVVILCDGDVVFRPRKVQRAGLCDAVDGHGFISIQKAQQLADVAAREPAARYVLVDDKPGILAAVRAAWGDRVTTVLPRQGRYAHDPAVRAADPPADVVIERIGDLLVLEREALVPPAAAAGGGTGGAR
jgi:hypothetical protein